MSYVLPAHWSLESLIEYAVAVAAALNARPETAPLAAPWREGRTGLRTARDARDDAREALIVASARVKVADVEWDAALVALSGQAFLDAGKDAGAPPYAPLFGALTAAQASGLGPHKATAFGARLLARAAEVSDANLGAPLARFSAANAALVTAAQVRLAAEEQALLHDARRCRLHDECQRLVALTEVGILTSFPGRRDLVSAVLAPPRAPSPRAEPHPDGEPSTGTPPTP